MISFWISFIYGTVFAPTPLQPVAYAVLYPLYLGLQSVGL